MSIRPVFATESTLLDTALNSLGATSAASSAEQDNSTNRYIDGRVDVECAGGSATTGFCTVYIGEGSATGKTSDTAVVGNMRRIGDVFMNGTSTVRKSFMVNNLPKFWFVRVVNASVAWAASGNTVKFTGINYEDV